ncbi:purine catabolism regulator [Pseudonocardia hierapolitana]|uniref:Purine catabolism regulator n=1 Tax=Pseudonocardia hierapolitana TaxID=1128676 RepID=A0A561SJY6_9PSEU|nr:PucR family transcriptional regulator [Pseudonocardia hierapolitana]TWF75206.1 purine catabolism regulator [Pseudonocardia hierapolitana]
MPILADLLRMPALGLRAVGTGRSDQPVRWVATSELADPTPYLEGGELLLTTGLVDHAEGWTGYTRRLAGAGVIGLGFGIGLSHSDVPADLVAAATAADLALLVVPESTPFIAISKAVAHLIAEEERASTVTALAVQRELTRAISRPDGIQRVLAILARAGHSAAGLVTPDGTAIAPTTFQLGDAARRALLALRGSRRRAAVTEVDSSGTTVVQPIGTDVPHAYLVLAARTPPDSVLRAALTTAVALLTLDAERSRAAADADLRLRDCAARLLLDGAPDAARSVAALLADRPDVPATVQVLRAENVPAAAREQIARTHPAALTTNAVDGRLAIVLGPRHAEEVERLLADLGCRIGVGTVVPVDQAGTSAAAAATALTATSDRDPVVRWDERFRGAVRAGLSDEAAHILAAEILRGLADEPELRRTLRAYLIHLGRWQPTADALGVHRNTLRKRIARIEALTGRSVDTAAGRADLWIALEIAGGA